MDFFDVVQERFSYRKKMDSKPIPLEDLHKIVEAGLAAPSGKNEQTTGFLIIQEPSIVKKIQSMPGANTAMATAPAYIACHINKEPVKTYQGYAFDVEDCAAAVQNMLLAATALGYASVWIDGWLRIDGRADEMAQLCALDEERTIRILLPIGKAIEQQNKPQKKGFLERVRIV